VISARSRGHPGAARVPAAAALVAVLALAACGGGGGRLTAAKYEQRLRAAGNELAVAEQKLAQARSKDDFQHEVGEVQHALDTAADDLHGITPPADAVGANDRLVHGLHGLSDDFDLVKKAADQGIDVAVRAARQVAAGASAREVQQAIAELKRRGYDVGQLGRS
jgi:iron-sulfur cluster repair protein YtfE (RIC family)